jgi:ABC-type branched-subunit amino acid transport system substrate-binding protein
VSAIDYKGQAIAAQLLSSVDVVMLFGMTEKAGLLLKDLKDMRTRSRAPGRPLVIVSDGSTTGELIDVSGASSECIWGSFPFGAPRAFLQRLDQTKYSAPSYYAYGFDAIVLAKSILASTGNNWSRAEIGREFRTLATTKQSIQGMAGRYEFDADGGLRFFLIDPISGRADLPAADAAEQYHLWRVQRDAGKLRWVHREYRTTLFKACP